jgi:hypothetical protein
MRSGTAIKIDVYLAAVMDVFVDESAICRRGEDSTRERSGDATNNREDHYDSDCCNGDYKDRDDACEEPHLYLLARGAFLYPRRVGTAFRAEPFLSLQLLLPSQLT